MLLPLSSHWSRESSELDGESQFNAHVSDITLSYYGSASVRPMLAPTRPKPVDEDDSFSPPQVLSDSTFSLLSRKYSPSTTESSCECSEASSVDENFQCGSGSPTMGPTNWEESSEHSNEELSAGDSDGDENTFSLLGSTPDVSMIIPLAGMPVTEQPPPPTQSSHGDTEDADSTEEETVSEATGREPAGLEDNIDVSLVEKKEDEADTAVILAVPTTTDVSLRSATANCNNEFPASTSVTETDSNSILSSSDTAVAVPRPRQSSLSSSTHTCSTCHLYAPSSSVTFYLEAWLKQQSDIRPSSGSESEVKSRKRVTWPDTTAELRNVIVVDKWIEKGVHVHPQPRSRTERYDDSDDEDDEDDEPECQQLTSSEKEEEKVIPQSKEGKEIIKPFTEVQVRVQQTPLSTQSQKSTAGSSKDSDCESVSPSAGLRLIAEAPANAQRKQETNVPPVRSTPLNKVPVQVQRKPESSVVKRPSPPSSVSSSSSGSAPSAPKPQQQQQRVIKHSKPADIGAKPNSAVRVVTQLPTPKKKYSSGVTVKIIGGPYSEHEAAMKLRGVDPIKHRAMIENYWQF